jgi:pimeloyl-ACP methyl ester carboxylesterase
MLSGALQVAGDEKFSHENDLRRMPNDWRALRAKIIYIQGGKDRLVPYEPNMKYAKAKVPAPLWTLSVFPDEDHFIPWTQFEAIKTAIIQELGN